MAESTDPIITTWQTHCRLNQNFVQEIPAEALAEKLLGKGRSVGAIIAHLHNNRLDWLKPGSPEHYQGLNKIQRDETNDPALLLTNLDQSGTAVAQWLAESLAKGGKVNAFGGQAATFMAYLIAHESYHHGEIGLILGQADLALNKNAAYALWNWR